LHHKTHNRINNWLKDLHEKGYIERIYSTTFGENTKPAIYSLGPNGIQHLKEQLNLTPQQTQKLRRQSDRTANFIARCLLLADIRVTLQGAAAAGGPTRAYPNYDFTTTAEVEDEENKFHFLADIKPQLTVTKHESVSRRAYTIIEAFDPTIPNYAIRKRVGEFADLYRSTNWEEITKRPFPRLLFICPTKAAMIYAKRHARKLLEENQNPKNLNIWFAIANRVRSDGVTAGIWEEA
jgi:hypothetical protein